MEVTFIPNSQEEREPVILRARRTRDYALRQGEAYHIQAPMRSPWLDSSKSDGRVG